MGTGPSPDTGNPAPAGGGAPVSDVVYLGLAAVLHPGFTGPSPYLHPPVLYWDVTEPLSSEEVEV